MPVFMGYRSRDFVDMLILSMLYNSITLLPSAYPVDQRSRQDTRRIKEYGVFCIMCDMRSRDVKIIARSGISLVWV